MTATDDPTHPGYLDEAEVRGELTRVFDVCSGCRRCVDLCTSFPTLFELIDRSGGSGAGEPGAGQLTPADQDLVVDECFHCTRCSLGCPYRPGLHEWAVDVPELMLRANAMRRRAGHLSVRSRAATEVLGRSHLMGGTGALSAGLADRMLAGAPGSLARRVVARITGVSSVRLVPPVARQRFSTWFRTRTPSSSRVAAGPPQGSVTVFPTCLVEYVEPRIGHDLVRVYEHNGITCAATDARCCGAPWLQAGDVGRFAELAATNVAILAAEIRRGTDVVVPQPACRRVLVQEYPRHVGGPDADLVAAHTYDAAAYLMTLHDADGTSLDTTFPGEVPATITHHVACHLRAQDVGVPGRDLLRLTGAQVTSVEQCAAAEGTWGLLAAHEDLAIPVAERLGARIDADAGEVVTGDCHRANTVITEQTARIPLHPLQVLARAYGIGAE